MLNGENEEERSAVRKRGGRKRALRTRAPMPIRMGASQRWPVDIASDALVDGQRFRVLCFIDDFGRECLATAVDNSIAGERVSREMDRIAQRRGYPLVVVIRGEAYRRVRVSTFLSRQNSA